MTAHLAPSLPAAPARRERPFRLISTPSAAHTDAELVEACRHGDQHAWGVLVQRHSTRLWSIARHQGLDAAAAEDAVQYGWSCLFTSLDRLDQPAAVGAWLAQTVRRHAIRMSKRQRRPPAPEQHPLAEPTSDERLIADEQVAALRRAVARLTPGARELLGLLFSPADLSYAEISRRIGRSCGSIGPTRGRCLDRLRELLQEELEGTAPGSGPAPTAA